MVKRNPKPLRRGKKIRWARMKEREAKILVKERKALEMA